MGSSARTLLGGGLAVGLALAGLAAGGGRGVPQNIWQWSVLAAAFAPFGLVVLRQHPGHRIGRGLVAAGALAAVEVVALCGNAWGPAAWLSQFAWFAPYAALGLTLLAFPDGRLPSPRWRPLAWLIAGTAAVVTVALAGAALDHPHDLLTGDPALAGRAGVLVDVARYAAMAFLAGLLGAVASVGVRWRGAAPELRRQLACLLAGGLVLLAGIALDIFAVPWAGTCAAVALPLAMTVAVLRYHLYALDQAINRTLVWLIMSFLVVVGFFALVYVLRDVLLRAWAPTAAGQSDLLATVAVALCFAPVRRRVQRGVDRLVYGDRDDPYHVLTRLGEVLGRTVEPTALLPMLADTIGRSLQVGYVAVELAGAPAPIEYGSRTAHVEAFPMVVHGERVGRLAVATRRPGSRFTARERHLLADVATQAAVAAESTRLTRDLQRSRERLIATREEERRRLRRELHDGLGPTLTGMAMQVRAASRLAGPADRVTPLLAALADDLRLCSAEVRQLVDGLRPPALDRGLIRALRAQAARFTGPGLAVAVEAPPDDTELPAAIEVAAYRIVAEALHNVAKHARATQCTVTVRCGRVLELTIRDDGAGLPPAGGDRADSAPVPAAARDDTTMARNDTTMVRNDTTMGYGGALPAGVGLASMCERATELGGDCTVTSGPAGTTVAVRLPTVLTAPAPERAAGSAERVAVPVPEWG
ncbi:hypothetical protein GCM10010123_26330 [Pilimelia anulata]|uniref:Histidine kinase/HSP90-like ATPase domain-containing protein n=1 Tax=Pilimelia anulata TaxID=53371 RepID=A0A8J3B9I8_9ACTN|nr:histidine kinase [Pilimelia anulata]GGJ95284.1 hypothetical protein GCM10010123_26330 [Pilimelia anulata]